MSWPRTDLVHKSGTHVPIRVIQVFDHAMIHQGLGFTHSLVHTQVTSGANIDNLLVTGSNPIHIRSLKVSSTGSPVSASYYEDTITSNDGTSLGIGNNNRTSSISSECTLTLAPTITTIGTLMGGDIYPSSGGGKSGSDGMLIGGEWILKPLTKYLIRFTNDANGNSDAAINLFWYEPQNRG